jgi:hypothetical protein
MAISVRSWWSRCGALLCSVLLISSNVPMTAQESERIPADQLDSLVAPIALYPDPLLAQVLAASTYPLEIIQLQQFLTKNTDLKDKALADAVMKQPWDPSVQALAPLPDVVKRLADDIQWTTDLGNAFLAQESDVMDAVQRMRMKAEKTGNLKSSDQVKVETKVVESKTVVVIEQANPQVIYVPSYNPTVVYGPPVYPYPPIYYPPPGYYAAGMAISFGIGVAMGAAWGWGGGWGWNCGWGRNNVNINVNNTYVRNYNNVNVNNKINSGNWQHSPQHRGGTPYSDRTTANRYGGATRGESMSNRQSQARQNQGQVGNRQQAGAGNRPSGGASTLGTNRPGTAGTGSARPSQGQGQAGTGNRASGGASTSGTNRPGTAGTGSARPSQGQGQAGTGNRASGGAGTSGTNRSGAGSAGTGGDRVGNRSVSPNTSAGSRNNALGGASSGMGGSGARESSARGTSSMGGGGGGRGGGGGAAKGGGRGR